VTFSIAIKGGIYTLMTPETLQLYKLIILYMLQQSKQILPNIILSDFMMENKYTDYLSIQETLNEMTQDHMISRKMTHQKSYYQITESGTQALHFFENQIPDGTKDQIEAYLQKNKLPIQKATSVQTDYNQIRPHEYMVTGTVQEHGQDIMSISISVPDEDMARSMSHQFQKKNAQIYETLFSLLTSDDDTSAK